MVTAMLALEQQLKRALLSGQAFALRRHRDSMQAERDQMTTELATIKSNLIADHMVSASNWTRRSTNWIACACCMQKRQRQ
jgi:hypothetical protein